MMPSLSLFLSPFPSGQEEEEEEEEKVDIFPRRKREKGFSLSSFLFFVVSSIKIFGNSFALPEF